MEKKDLEIRRCTGWDSKLPVVKCVVNKLLALVALLLCFVACNEPVDEIPAKDIYFSKDNGGRVEIAVDAKSFDVVLNRVAADGSVRVPMTVTADSLANAWFNFPDAVEFADAALSATYTVTVKDGAVLEYDKYSRISLAIGSEYAAVLGDAVYSFEVGVPAPWSEWEKIGEGTYYPTVYWSTGQAGLSLYYRECLVNDADAQFCIAGIQNTMNLTVEYDRLSGACRVLPQYAATNYKYGQVTVADVLHSPVPVVRSADEESPCTYDAAKGLFAFNLAYVVSTQWGGNADESFGSGVERFQLDGFLKQDADYSFAMQFRGHYIDANGVDNAVISVSKGADVAGCLMAVVAADDNTDATVQGMLAGSVACDTLTAGGFYACPMTASGNYKAVAITYNAEGEIIEPHTVEFEFWVAADSNPWQSLGYAMLTDDIIRVWLDEPKNYSYPVEVLESKEQPGLFRIINPFEFFGADASKDYYVEIDATDPQGVWINGYYDTGYNIGYGNMMLSSVAYYKVETTGAAKEEVKEAGYCGTFADGVITFPMNGLAYYMPGYKDAAVLVGNRNGAFKLDMTNMTAEYPEESAPESAAACIGHSLDLNKDIEVMGNVGRFKKIDNSFLAPMELEF